MIRKAVREDFEFFFAIKSEEDNLYWCGYKDKPVRENLLAFWNRYVPDGVERESHPEGGSRKIYIVQEEEHPVGYMYIDYISDKETELSIGISITKSGKGYGTKAIREAVTFLNAAELSAIAYIREDNDKSKKLFSKAGLHQTNEYREMILPFGEYDRTIKLYKWQTEKTR